MEQKQIIDLKAEINALLFKKPYMSLRQIANKVNIEPCFVIDAITGDSGIKKCGEYFNPESN